MKSLTKEDKNFIKNLSKEMNTQDTRCTAQPFGLVLMEEVERLVPDGYGGEYMVYMHNEEQEFYEWDDFINYLKDYYEYGTEAFNDYTTTGYLKIIIEEMSSFNELKDTTESEECNFIVHCVTREHEIKLHNTNFFLTEKAYTEHLRRNGHNLNNPQSYGIHFYRNEEIETLINIVHKLAKELETNCKAQLL